MTRFSLLALSGAILASCRQSAGPSPLADALAHLPQHIEERGGLVLANDAYGDSANRVVYLDQGWGPLETLWYYHADQGSELMPYATLIHLEQADSTALFIDPANLTRFRFLPQHATPNNPDALPVGFSRHADQVGLTCAACHTTQVNYRGTAVRIDGGQALADVAGFLRAVEAALSATLADDGKLSRFAAATGQDQSAARQSLTATQQWFHVYNSSQSSATVEGFGRMDAITRIFNATIRATSDAKNSLEPNAPTNYPELWDEARHDYVQWTGFAPNAGPGSLGRNCGEVIGVFGHVDVKHYTSKKDAKKGYPSSISATDLVAMEEALWKLESPVWPEDVLPPIDRSLAARGATLYQADCVSCHAILNRKDPKRRVTAMITGVDKVGTDPTEVEHIMNDTSPSGVLEGAMSPQGEIYGARMGSLDLLLDLVGRSLAENPAAAVHAIADAKLHGIATTPRQGDHLQPTDADPHADLRSYKARPLNGIWASSPYLHNGSVPTLADLLLPPDARPKTFSVGRWEYDPVNVGYRSDGDGPFVLDTSLKGNSNQGHLYGTDLSEEDRKALVEYLKTL